jgi:hypothetical protein
MWQVCRLESQGKQVPEYYVTAFVYFIQQGDQPLVKIGTTVDQPAKRLAQLQVGNASPLRLLGAIDMRAAGAAVTSRTELARIARAREAEIHQVFAEERVAGEWFRLTERVLTLIKQATNC